MKVFENYFVVKEKSRASTSIREIHDLKVSLDLASEQILTDHCTCEAGNSRYCNRVMSLLIQLANYSLEELGRVSSKGL